MIGIKHILLYTLALSLVLVLSSCKSKVKAPPPPPQMPSMPSSKPPSAKPPSSMPSIPSPPSKPSTSPPSTQPPSAQPPAMPSPSMPPPSSPSQTKSSDKSTSKSKKGEQGKPGAEPKETAKEKGDRQKAGEDLQKVGEEIAQAGGQLGDTSSSDDVEPDFPVDDSDKIGDQAPDVLMPESDATSESDELVFEESESSVSSSSTSESSEAAENASESSSSESEIADAETETSSENEAIQAAQEALEEAGVALQRAGQAVSDAESEAALEAAEQLLSNARIKIILAEQDLSVLGDSEIDEETSADIADINAAINEANVYLVVATQSILNARTGLPAFPSGTIAGNAKEKGPVGDLDEELEQSLIIFDGELEAARATIIDTTSAPTGDIVGIQTDRPSGNATYPEDGQEEGEEEGEGESLSNGEDQIASTKPSLTVPEGMPSAQGDDIVAHQLREAATAETDPQLKEKLWEEYRRYKSGL
ncbi:MAG: hypothetical protein ACJA2O_002236 [Candidatus Azotimanducaceae bacterium]|jgi:hypothetical protein